jgi:peptide/nickel transport system permease protein
MQFFRKKKQVPSYSLSGIAWIRFKKNKLALISLYFIAFLFIVTILGYLITPDSTPFSNDQHVEIATKKPGFTQCFLLIPKNEPVKSSNFLKKMIWGEKLKFYSIPIYKYYFANTKIYYELYTGSVPNDGEIKSSPIADIIYSNSIEKNKITFSNDTGIKQDKISLQEFQKEISKKNIIYKTFWFGTDCFGRDMLSQLIIGSRVSLYIGFISVLISLLIGVLLGALAGYYRGWVDNLIMWFINVIWSIPTLLLVIAISFALGKGFWQVFIAVGLTMWVDVARVVRGEIMGIREKEYIEATKALGFNNFRIIFKHILPNVMGSVIVISASNFASAILIEAGLSFLGIGIQPPMPSWGIMIKEHYNYIVLYKAYLSIIPGLAIMLTVLAFMIIGNALRDSLDSKSFNALLK